MPPRMLRHHNLHQASCHGQPHPYRKPAVATPFINLCLKYSLGASPRPGVLRGSPHPETKELPSSDTWFSYVLDNPEGLLVVPSLSPS